MEWTLETHAEATPAVIGDWEHLREGIAPQNPALAHAFLGALTAYFGNGREVIAIGRVNGLPKAGAIVQPTGLGTASAFVPGQACLSPILIDPDLDPGTALSGLMRRLRGSSALLRLPQVDPWLVSVDGIAEVLPIDKAVFGTSFSINVAQDFDTYWGTRAKRLRYNIRKAFRKTEAAGINVGFRTIRDVMDISEGVAVHGDLEGSGWKGQAGTAIRANNEQGRFYTEVLTAYAQQGNTLICQLLFDQQPAASLLCIRSSTTVIVLKTAFQEAFKSLSPGRLVDYFFLKMCCEDDQLSIADMYTKASPSDLSWATDTRDLMDVNVYSSRLVRALARSRRAIAQRIALRNRR